MCVTGGGGGKLQNGMENRKENVYVEDMTVICLSK